MSAFAVFATVLTIGYIIYYGFTISRDIIASKKAEKNEAETFDVEPVDQPQPTAVSETNDGFSISPKMIEENIPVEVAPAPPIEVVADDTEGPTESKAEELVAKVNEEMEPMVEASEPGYTPDEFDNFIHASLKMAKEERIIAITVVDDTHGQEVPDTPDNNTEDNADENAQPDDSQEEIRL